MKRHAVRGALLLAVIAGTASAQVERDYAYLGLRSKAGKLLVRDGKLELNPAGKRACTEWTVRRVREHVYTIFDAERKRYLSYSGSDNGIPRVELSAELGDHCNWTVFKMDGQEYDFRFVDFDGYIRPADPKWKDLYLAIDEKIELSRELRPTTRLIFIGQSGR